MSAPTLPIDFNDVRTQLVRAIQLVTQLDDNHVITVEPEIMDVPRPTKPYVSLKLTTPSAKTGDDDKRHIPNTTKWISGGVRKMTVSFQAYGRSHEEAYNYMALLQTGLDLENIQEFLRRAGIAVWIIGNVADLSQLLNTGFEGRAQMDCTFGIAMNLTSDLGQMDSVAVEGEVTHGTDTDELDFTVTVP